MAATDEEVRSPSELDIQIMKWKVKKGSHVFKHSVLALYKDDANDDKSKSSKLKAHESGIVVQIRVEEGAVAHPGDVLLVIQPQTDSTCTHPTIMKDMCAECGADLRSELGVAGDRKKSVSASVAMVHSIPELVVSQEQAMELGQEDEDRLLRERKLVLLVDLDQTLIHTTNDNIPPNLKDVKHFQLWHGKGYMWYHTRFRPYTQQFLETVSKMYELHICTFGVRMYAHIIARLLDPEEKYFSHRILSRDECFDALSKTANLKALFPCGDKMVAIIDDREDVWNHAPNLVHVKPYRFFQGTADINAPPGLTKSEHDNEPIAHKLVDHSKDKKDDDASDCKPDSSNVGGEEISQVTEISAEGKSNSDGENKVELMEEGSEKSHVSNESENSAKPDEDGNNKNGDSTMEVVKDNSDESSLISLCSEAGDEDKGEVSSETTASQDNNDVSTTGTDNKEESDKSAEKEEENDVDEVDSPGDKDNVESTASVDEKKDDVEEIEWDDDDDYLLHLEEILTRIHKAYYGMFEQSQSNGSKELPDLKNILPYVRKKVLKGANIVFSGMFPLNMPAEKSRAYKVAKALGANVQHDFVPRKTKNGTNVEATSHLVAAKPGTGKHKTALKTKGIHIVSGDWLWACSERWEWVDETLFGLANKDSMTKGSGSPEYGLSGKGKSKKRKNDDDNDGDADEEEVFEEGNESFKASSLNKRQKFDNSGTEVSDTTDSQPSTSKDDPTEVPEENFANSFNPLYSFSDEDIEFMDKEVDEILDEDEDSSEETDEEREARIRQEVLKKSEDSDSDSESLSGDFPRGWKMRRKSFSPKNRDIEEEDVKVQDDDETENELERYNKNMAAFAPDDTEPDSSDGDDSIGSVDDEIAEAVEKEFLSSL